MHRKVSRILFTSEPRQPCFHKDTCALPERLKLEPNPDRSSGQTSVLHPVGPLTRRQKRNAKNGRKKRQKQNGGDPRPAGGGEPGADRPEPNPPGEASPTRPDRGRGRSRNYLGKAQPWPQWGSTCASPQWVRTWWPWGTGFPTLCDLISNATLRA